MKSLAVKRNLQLSFMFYLSLSPCIFLISFFGTVYANSLNPIMFGFVIFYVYTMLFSIRFFGLLSLYCIFLYTSAFFIYDCFFFTLFFDENFLLQTFPVRLRFDEKVGFIFIIVCFVSVYVMHISYCLIDKKRYKRINVLTRNNDLNKFGKFLMLVFFVPVIVKLMIQFNYVRIHGYLSIYRGGLEEISYPFWTAGSFIFFISGYCLFLASGPYKKEYLVFSIMCFFVYFANSLKGQRGGFLAVLLYLIYYYTKHFNVKLRLKKILLMGVFFIAFILILGNLRNSYGGNKKNNTKINTKELIGKTLYTQTTTRAVPMHVIKGGLKYHNYPFIFSSFTKPFLRYKYPSESGQTDLIAQKYNKSTAVITYNVSRAAYLNGNGLGSSFIAEAYDCFGFFGLIVFSVILSWFFVFCDFSRVNPKRIFVPILFFIIQNIPILPRANIFRFLDTDPVAIIFAYILFLVGTIAVYVFKFQWRSR